MQNQKNGIKDKKGALIALALGGFGIGTGEFVIMGLLPDVADSLNISEPQAGNTIASYASGVVLGAPLIAILAARMARKYLLILLMALFFMGNIASALSESYTGLVIARFITGIPHGAYFGVASLVAVSMVPVTQRGKAMSYLMMGLTLATLAGVPLGAWIGQRFSWHIVFAFVGGIGFITCLLIACFVPFAAGDCHAHPLRELGALRNRQVLLTLLIGSVGFGGLFAIFSYITPTLINVAGMPEKLVPWVMVFFGLGMITGNLIGGMLSDERVLKTIGFTLAWTIIVMAGFPLMALHVISGMAAAFLLGTTSASLPALQIRLMDVAKNSQTLAAAMNHSALNIGNALGAYLGGLAVSLGFGWLSTAYVGVILGIIGMMVYAVTVYLSLEK